MSGYLVGATVLVTVTVTDTATGSLVDPSLFAFTLAAPRSSGYTTGTYTWNGSTWSSTEAAIAVPARVGLGVFTLRVTIPYRNIASGRWTAGWETTANDAGRGGGSGELEFHAITTSALP